MHIKLTTLILTTVLLFGCQTTTSRIAPIQLVLSSIDENSTSKTAPIQPDISSELEDTKHKVWKEASYKGIRSELKEGEIIIFKNVEAKISSDGSYYYLGDIYSIDNQKLFDTKYSLGDIGIFKYNHTIDRTVNPDAVISSRGVQYHGVVTSKNGFSDTYWKTTGGDSPKATPVRDFRSKLFSTHKVAETENNGLNLYCLKGGVEMTFSGDIFAAQGENSTVTVYYPYSKGKEYSTKSVGHNSVWLTIDEYIERILLEEDAIKLVAYSHVNGGLIENTSYINGLAEAYSRVKSNCSL